MVKLKHPGIQTKVHWHPYFLNKNLPAGGVDKYAHYVEKFGRDRVEKMFPMMKKTGRNDNIAFSFGGIISNTMDSHRLVYWAQKNAGPEEENKVVEALFKRYFEQEQNIGSLDVLLSAAEEAGLDVAKVKPYLQSTDDKDKIDAMAREVTIKNGMDGVPFYIIGFETKKGGFKSKVRLSGAQDSNYFAAVFETLVEEYEDSIKSEAQTEEDDESSNTKAKSSKSKNKMDDKYSMSSSDEE